MMPGPRIKPGPHWWEASALTTAPTLFCYFVILLFCYLVWFRSRRVASSSCHATRSQTVFCKRIGDCQDC